MNQTKKIIRTERHEDKGYVVKFDDIGKNYDGSIIMKSAYNLDDVYIGNDKIIKLLVKRGIGQFLPTKKGGKICSIGFCEKEQKWYGWSHRAIYGFGVGSKIKMGDSGYEPSNLEDMIEDCVSFYKTDDIAKIETNVHGDKLHLKYIYKDNEKSKNMSSGVTCDILKKWGKGEWTAKNLEDAKQMAIDFANDVS